MNSLASHYYQMYEQERQRVPGPEEGQGIDPKEAIWSVTAERQGQLSEEA